MSSNIDKSRNYAKITITHFLKNTPFLQSFLYICMVYFTPETQSNILIIIILLQPELENDVSTPAQTGGDLAGLRHIGAQP